MEYKEKKVEEKKHFLRWSSWSSPVGLAIAMVGGCSILMVGTAIFVVVLKRYL
jgi:hypothetical protein